jgi:hypothetical protein
MRRMISAGPHVDAPGGLVQDQELGFGEQPAGEQHLLLVAPGEKLDGLLRSRGLDGQLLDEAGGDLVLLLARRGCNQPRWACRASTMFSRTEAEAMMPALLRSSGQKPKPLAAAWRAERMVTGLSRTRHSPLSLGTMPNISSAVSVRPDPSRPAGHYLPGHDVETEGGDDSPLAIVPERHHGLVAAQCLARPLEGIVVQLAPQHHLDQLQLWQCLECSRCRPARRCAALMRSLMA